MKIRRFPRIYRFPRIPLTPYEKWLESPPNPHLVPITRIREGRCFLYEYGFQGELRQGRILYHNTGSTTVDLDGKTVCWDKEAPVIPIMRFPRLKKVRRFPR